MTIGMVTVDEVTELISRNEAAIKLDRVAYAKKYREEHPDTPYAYAAQLAKAKVPTQELAVTRKTKHELPPDTTAQIFWLKNRRPDLWRDRREVANQVSGHLDGPDMSHLTTAQLMLSPTRKLMMTMTVNVALKRYAQYELARRDFFEYAHLMAPSFYQRKREYLISLCRDLQDFVTGKDNVLVINLPPRHGKSRTASMFVEWLLGRSPSTKVMTGSYNETLSTTFSKAVRNTIQEVKADPAIPVYEDVFPKTHIKQGDGAMNMWALEGGYNNYLATSPTGTATGFGADIEIIDDLIKNNEEANNETVLDKQWSWFTDTMLTRLETGGKIIIIMTRWSSLDLAGRALAQLPGLGYSVKHVNMKALQDDGTMLCDDVLTREEFDRRYKTLSPEIAAANYQQEPIDQQGRLYKGFKTYNQVPMDDVGKPLFTGIYSYTDTADEGSDWLASYVFGLYNGEAYILDVTYTQAPMEETEPAVAQMFYTNKVNQATIESNNGGRGFAREVEKLLRDQMHSNLTVIQWFHNNKNKKRPHYQQRAVGHAAHLLSSQLARPLAGLVPYSHSVPTCREECT